MSSSLSAVGGSTTAPAATTPPRNTATSSAATAAAAAAESSSSSSSSSSLLRLMSVPEKVSALVLDADAPQRSALVEQLDLCNYTVGTADNFADALRKLRSKHNTSEPYHLLLADLAFLDANNDVITQVREDPLLCDLPIIILATVSGTNQVYQSLHAGADDFFLRPIHEQTLQGIWQNIWRKRKERHMLAQLQKERTERQMLQRTLSKMQADMTEAIETPLQLIIQSLQSVIKDDGVSDETRNTLMHILSNLKSSNMYEPALHRIVFGDEIDPNTRVWLEQVLFLGKRRGSGASHSPGLKRTSSRLSMGHHSRRSSHVGVSGVIKLPDNLVERLRAQVDLSTSIPPEVEETPLQQLMSSLGQVPYADDEAETLLKSLRTRQFDLWGYAEEDLSRMVLLMFYDLELLESCDISPLTLWNFIKAVKAGYRDTNPFHNFRHGFDVAQGVYVFLNHENMMDNIDCMHVLALLVAALCHDVGHPGTSNNFQIVTSSPLALLYNDTSVLENFHCAETFRILASDNGKNNLLSSLKKEDYRDIRSAIIRGIMATDLSKHMEILSRINQVADSFSWTEPSHLQLSFELLIKCADVSNPTRPVAVAKYWTDMLEQEFFLQGDKERELSVTISPFMDRNNPNQPRMAISFIDYIVLPLYQQTAKILPFMTQYINPLRATHAFWSALTAQQQKPSQ